MKEHKPFYVLDTKEEMILWVSLITYIVLMCAILHHEVIVKKEILVKANILVQKQEDEKNRLAKMQMQQEKDKLEKMVKLGEDYQPKNEIYKENNLDVSILYKYNKLLIDTKFKVRTDYQDVFKNLDSVKKWEQEILLDKEFLKLAYKNKENIKKLMKNGVLVKDVKDYVKLINKNIEKMVKNLNPREKVSLDKKIDVFSKDYEDLIKLMDKEYSILLKKAPKIIEDDSEIIKLQNEIYKNIKKQ